MGIILKVGIRLHLFRHKRNGGLNYFDFREIYFPAQTNNLNPSFSALFPFSQAMKSTLPHPVVEIFFWLQIKVNPGQPKPRCLNHCDIP
jgi:hypothetical protein